MPTPKRHFPTNVAALFSVVGMWNLFGGVRISRMSNTPKTYPRDARTAYLMDPNDLIKIHKEAETENRPIKAFYHSHPNHDAYFSEKDKADATVWDEPMYPDAAYLVVSIYDKAIRVARAYAWSDVAGDFVEVSINAKAS